MIIYTDGNKRVNKPIKIYEYTAGGSYTDVTIPAMANYNRFRLTLVAGSSILSIEVDKTMPAFAFYPLGSTNIDHDINLPMSEVVGYACGSQIFLDWTNNRITVDVYARTDVNFMTGLSQVHAIA